MLTRSNEHVYFVKYEGGIDSVKFNIQLRLASGAVLLVFIICLTSCERYPRVFIENGTPLSFIISGPGSLNHFEITGPDLELDSNNRQGDKEYLGIRKVYWHLVPSDSNKNCPLDKIGVIVYGQVPSGLTQTYPEKGPPPPLIERDLYHVSLVHNEPGVFGTFFAIRDGRVLAVGQD